ncbi:cysteine protease StiP domain-containing protein [Deinococcus ficus]|uniref:Uncharacterized protein n=1 Tax=Deinococcus ficus TaxID=317577 RepID=A0A221T2S3_9DEIO|nr:cysteine protease StiP domain-containing protein [Deinococcus ficus]ASN83150.1 hypothetical protein DFI_18285 [Deinococcus ficus]
MNHTFPTHDVRLHLDSLPPAPTRAPEDQPIWAAHFDRTLHALAARTAGLVAAVARQVMEAHPAAVLVSLARGGTPAGILLRREAARHGLTWPHHSLSITRRDGLDLQAYREVLDEHPGRDVVFVDGWTGLGGVTRALEASVKGARLAVLSDPAGCSTYAGTYQDVLIPHALLGAAGCGLLSHPVAQRRGRHAAAFKPQLSGDDRTGAYLRAVSLADPLPPERGRRPSAAADYALLIAGLYGVSDPARLRAGVGEASRALLRRDPQELLLRQSGTPDTRHLEDEARRRSLPVYVHADLPYLACALTA